MTQIQVRDTPKESTWKLVRESDPGYRGEVSPFANIGLIGFNLKKKNARRD